MVNSVEFIKIEMMHSIFVNSMKLPDMIGPIAEIEPERLSTRRAIVWGRNDLLVQAVGSFLKSTGWDAIHILSNEDVENLVGETKKVNPEVVILCREKTDESALALRLIDEKCCLRVITLGLDNNHIQIYSKQSVTLRGAADLLSIIERGYFSDCRPGKEAGGTDKTIS
jgi:hypothetical protein